MLVFKQLFTVLKHACSTMGKPVLPYLAYLLYLIVSDKRSSLSCHAAIDDKEKNFMTLISTDEQSGVWNQRQAQGGLRERHPGNGGKFLVTKSGIKELKLLWTNQVMEFCFRWEQRRSSQNIIIFGGKVLFLFWFEGSIELLWDRKSCYCRWRGELPYVVLKSSKHDPTLDLTYQLCPYTNFNNQAIWVKSFQGSLPSTCYSGSCLAKKIEFITEDLNPKYTSIIYNEY